jgi:hypothetical protein
MILLTVTVTPLYGGDRYVHHNHDGAPATRMRQKTGLHPGPAACRQARACLPEPRRTPAQAETRLPGRTGSEAQAVGDSAVTGVATSPVSCSRRRLRPRCRRDMTVPTGVPMISAISR